MLRPQDTGCAGSVPELRSVFHCSLLLICFFSTPAALGGPKKILVQVDASKVIETQQGKKGRTVWAINSTDARIWVSELKREAITHASHPRQTYIRKVSDGLFFCVFVFTGAGLCHFSGGFRQLKLLVGFFRLFVLMLRAAHEVPDSNYDMVVSISRGTYR